MCRVVAGSVALAAFAFVLAGPAFAADMPVRAQPLPRPAPAWTWSGCYMGLNAGYGWDRDHIRDAAETTDGGVTFRFSDFDLDSKGWFGGGQFGCNWQASALMLGLEADFQGAEINSDTVFTNAIFNFPSALFNTRVTSELEYFGTVRGRIGYAFTPSAMLYATGGFAYGGIETSLSFPFVSGLPNTFVNHARQTHYGYAVGGGAEALITPRMSVKAEYLYVDLGARTHSFLIAGDTYSWSQRAKLHTVKLGVNFLWPAAVVAKY
jgi:outer membrane immunogenic protein